MKEGGKGAVTEGPGGVAPRLVVDSSPGATRPKGGP